MYLSTILGITNFSVDGDYAVDRAAQLAVSCGATLELLHSPASSNPVCAGHATPLAKSASAISNRQALTVHTVDSTATTSEYIAGEASGADLLVIPHRRERTLKAFLCGQPPIRLLRLCQCPIPVTQRASRMRLRRTLVAVDFVPPAHHLTMLARPVDEKAQVELFHVVSAIGEARLREAEMSQAVIKTFRQSCAKFAQGRMSILTEAVGATTIGVLPTIGRDDSAPQAVTHQEYVGADILVIGKRRSTVAADFFLGSTARRVLGYAKCDGLVVPHAFQPSTSAVAKLQIRNGFGIENHALGCIRGTNP